ncbi:MAG: hypothetical protein II472_03565, partial [Lachnospiraceae bacterium]|nr:hypothetical protein [Lachnospiraceae bacterium]
MLQYLNKLMRRGMCFLLVTIAAIVITGSGNCVYGAETIDEEQNELLDAGDVHAEVYKAARNPSVSFSDFYGIRLADVYD